MRITAILAGTLMLAACDPISTGSDAPKGPPLEIVQASRLLDTTSVVMRYRNGSPIAVDDEGRAATRAAEIACMEGETAIPDTRTREEGLLTINVFCVAVTTSEEVIDGSGLRS